MKNFFKRLKGKKKFVFTTQNLARHTGNGNMISSDSNDIGGFISIDNAAMTWVQSSANQAVMETSGSEPKQQLKNQRKAVEPKEVFNEIKVETPEVSFDNLDEKIKVVEERIKILSEHLDEGHLVDEHKALFYLKNRKAYLKSRTRYPLDWAMTTADAIEDLCARYQLRSVPLKQYYTLIPKEGIKEMDRFSKAYTAITGDKPIFQLIIKDSEVKEEVKQQKKKDRDPILVANSPLGNFMFVLGAWDDEVEIVDEIIYGLK